MKCTAQNFVKRLQLGKEDALEYIVDQYMPLVKGIVLKILSPLQNNGVIDECMNDIFLSIWNNANKFKGEPEAFQFWLASVAKFKAIDYYRKTIRQKETVSEDIEIPRTETVEQFVVAAENQKELLSYIHSLEPIDQKILVMRLFLGYSTEEIASHIGLTKSAVDSRLFRGRKKLTLEAKQLLFGGDFS